MACLTLLMFMMLFDGHLLLRIYIVSLCTIIIKHFFSINTLFPRICWVLAVSSLMMIIFRRAIRWICLFSLILGRIQTLRTISVTVIFITWKIGIVDRLWTVVVSRRWLIFASLLLVIVIWIRKLSFNGRTVKRISVKMESCSFINKFRL